MGGIAAVHILVVVIAQYIIPSASQLLSQGEVAVGTNLAGALHGDGASVFGIQAQQGLALTVGSAGKVEGGVVVVKYKPLMRHLPQRGSKLWVQRVAREALQYKKNHVVSFKHAGVLVLVGWSHTVEVVG